MFEYIFIKHYIMPDDHPIVQNIPIPNEECHHFRIIIPDFSVFENMVTIISVYFYFERLLKHRRGINHA
jgi:hypothetical protein